MILESIELKNIRSYDEQKIEFPRGITLFEGDIGSGKSTILMAIEFAFFGTGSQKGDAMLSKKAKDGSVKLRFEVDGEKYEIYRELKRTAKAVNQHPTHCHLKIGEVENPFSPGELKQEILKILKFNEPASPNAHSKIYRYAIFTPQEEMKQILYDSDKRQETIRRAFGVEDYKNAKQNAMKVNRDIENESIRYQERSKVIPELEDKLHAFENSKKKNQEVGKKNDENKERLEKEIVGIEKEIVGIEEKSRQKNEYENKKKIQEEIIENLGIYELENEINELEYEINERREQIVGIEGKKRPTEITKDVIGKKIDKIKEFEKIRSDLHHNENEPNEIDQQIGELEYEINERREQIVGIEGKKRPTEITKDVIGKKIDKIKKIEEKQSTLLHNKSAYSKNILQLKKLGTKCVFCQQEITKEHSERLVDERNDALEKTNSLLENNYEKIKNILNDTGIDSVENAVDDLLGLRQDLIEYERLSDTLSELREKQKEDERKLSDKERKKKQLEDDFEKSKSVYEKIRNILNDTGIDSVENAVDDLLGLRQDLIEYERLSDTLSELREKQEQEMEKLSKKEKREKEMKDRESKLEEEITKLKEKINEFPDYEEEKEEQEERRREMEEELDEIKDTLGRIKGENKNLIEQISDLKNQIEKSIQWVDKYKKLENYQTWIKQFFIPTTDEIERQVLNSIRHDFNETFRNWFKILIDDSSKDSRLDEDFTPILEQDGFEQNFYNLSGGEKTSISLAYRLSLNTMMRKNTESLRSNLLILDEPTDGFSKNQLSKVRDVLKELGSEQIILVSHESELEGYVDNIFQISKSEGYSKIK